MDAELERLRMELAQERRLARLDPLTQLWNRRGILELLYREFDRARREHSRVAVLFVDLDEFKGINDSVSHAAGDEVLCEIAARMRSVVRIYDSVGRYGGDEFVVIIAGTGADRGASCVSAEITAKIRGQPIATTCGTVRVTASVGIAVAPAGAREPDRLIADADQAMYTAKVAGGDTVRSSLLP